jgi:hypothetical protein
MTAKRGRSEGARRCQKIHAGRAAIAQGMAGGHNGWQEQVL